MNASHPSDTDSFEENTSGEGDFSGEDAAPKSFLTRLGAKGRATFVMALCFCISLVPKAALAGGTGTFALEAELQQFIDLISGPFGITVGTLAIIGCFVGMVFKSQRGEPFGKLGIAVVGIFGILNVESIMNFFFTANGSLL